MKRYLSYLKYVLRHKYFVAAECFKYGLYWRGILHDMSKFHPAEFGPYARSFYDEGGKPRTVRDKSGYYDPLTQNAEFARAWAHHAHRNDHHWQCWVVARDRKETEFFAGGQLGLDEYFEEVGVVVPMTVDAIIEMICDWVGAGWAQKTSGVHHWYEKNKGKLRLHPNTRAHVEALLDAMVTKAG